MTHRILFLVLAGLIGTAAAMPVLAQCDEAVPELIDFDFNPKIIDVTSGPQPVTVTVDVTDDLSGLDLVGVQFLSPTATQTVSCNSDTPASGTPTNGTYTCVITFDGNPEQGTWLADSVTLSDRVGRGDGFFTDDLILRGLPTELEIVSNEDIDAPVLQNLTVTPDSVDVSAASREVDCTMTVTDNLAGTTAAICRAESPVTGHAASCVELFPDSGTPQNGVFSCTMVVPRYAEAGDWAMTVQFSDAEDNVASYEQADLAALSLPDQITVASSPQDLTPPTLVDFDLQPPSVNVENDDGTVTCSAVLTDDLAGTAFFGCSGTFIDPSFQFVTQACAATEPDSGTRLDGSWSCDLTIPQYSPGGVWGLVTASYSDVLGNADAADSTILDAAGFPSSFEVVCGTGSGGLSPRAVWADGERLTWNAIPGAILYDVYGAALSTLVDGDGNGLPDAGYGACRNSEDLNPTDTEFVDDSDPAAGTGEFLLVGYRTIFQTGLGLGQTSAGQDRTPTVACP